MKVTKATVLIQRNATDIIWLETDLPNPIFPFKGQMTVRFDAAGDTGEDYVKEHFPGVPVEIISSEY